MHTVSLSVNDINIDITDINHSSPNMCVIDLEKQDAKESPVVGVLFTCAICYCDYQN